MRRLTRFLTHRFARKPAGQSLRRLVQFSALVSLSVTGLVGCVTTGPMTAPEQPPEAVAKALPPEGTVCRMTTTWGNQVAFIPDPAQNGAKKPGLAGRIYLLGRDLKYPMTAEGSVVIDLYDDGPAKGPQEPRMLEEWRIDNNTLQRLAGRDMIGWGYTIFLPWGTYKPEITRVHLAVRFTPVKGQPLVQLGDSMVLSDESSR